MSRAALHRRGALAIALPLAFALALSQLTACGLMADGTYRLGSKTYKETVSDASPTAETIERVEYLAARQTDTTIALTCHARTRQIERRWDTDKIFQYRGGYRRSTYVATAIIDGVVGAIVTGSLLGICTSGESQISCYNMLWGAPFALDAIYSVVRAKTVGEPVLINKKRWPDQLAIGSAPLTDTPVACDQLEGVWFGRTHGMSDNAALERASEGPLRTFDERAIELAVTVEDDGSRAVVIDAEVAAAWARDYSADIWVKDRQQELHQVDVDRCGVLRPFAARFDAETRKEFDQDCPVPQL